MSGFIEVDKLKSLSVADLEDLVGADVVSLWCLEHYIKYAPIPKGELLHLDTIIQTPDSE